MWIDDCRVFNALGVNDMNKSERKIIETIARNGLIQITPLSGSSVDYKTANKLVKCGVLAMEHDVYTFNVRRFITECGFEMAKSYQPSTL